MKISASQAKLKVLIFASNLIIIMFFKSVFGRSGVDHCYTDIGCFPLSPEFYHPRHRPFNVRPWHRSRIKIQFDLYNRQHPEGFVLEPWDKLNLLVSGWNPKLETKIIIPGWLDNVKRALWVKRMRDSFLWLWKPVNLIVVQWRNFTPYTIATANTRVVGAELANLIKWIEHELAYDRAYYHLIGHSLGAHIAGYCGDRVPGLGRITALDPARPFFQHMPKSVRLDRADARFVDAIHSDFTPENAIFLLMSFGMTTPVGHLDFYPNGPPLLQPGCLRDTLMSLRNGIQRGFQHKSLPVLFLETVRYLTACDHQRSHEWFIESITNRQCLFVGVRCNQFEGVINGRCTCDDSRSACAVMGIHADQMYLNDAHEDLWPVQASKHRNKPVDFSHHHHHQLYSSSAKQKHPFLSTSSKEQIYSHLRESAFKLRHPPMPQHMKISGNIAAVDNLLLGSSIHDDAPFMDYLRTNLLSRRAGKSAPHPLEKPALFADSSSSKKHTIRRQGFDIANIDDLLLGGSDHIELGQDGHPKLLSDFDRDIENWYEGESRWYLKTNHRPSYCVNQYQVLVFIGPLRSTSGMRKLRANLIISIIGSRGQLMNQRFIPRSSNLDSFTMQPFFILLEGSYSLGNIMSVAIAWEPVNKPDPVKATVTFQSNKLESIQAILPTYNAKHPWLSETLKYDFTGAFKHSNKLMLDNAGRLEKRALNLERHNRFDATDEHPELSKCNEELDLKSSRSNQLPCSNRMKTKQDLSRFAHVDELLSGESSLLENTTDLFANEADIEMAEIMLDEDDEMQPLDGKTSHILSDIHKQNELLEALHEFNIDADGITAKLHNIPVHLDRDLEDSIVISRVQVIPIQANYGKTGTKLSKVFCPPSASFRLRKRQTVRLEASFFDRCHISY